MQKIGAAGHGRTPVRLAYNRCGPADRVRIVVPVEDGASFVHLMDITPGGMRDPEATLEISEHDLTPDGLLPGFLIDGSLEHSVRVANRAAVSLAIDNAALRAALERGDGALLVSGSITRVLDIDRQDRAPLLVEVTILHVGLPRPKVSAEVEPSLNVNRMRPVDGRIQIGRIELAPEAKAARYQDDAGAEVVFHAQATLSFAGQKVAASLRPCRTRQSESEWVWREAAAAFSDTLVFNDEERAFAIFAIDIGIKVASLRELLRRSHDVPAAERQMQVDLRVWFTRGEEDEPPFPPFEHSGQVEFAGELPEILTFSGLCDPFSVSLAETGAEPYQHTLPELWLFRPGENSSRLESDQSSRTLFVQYEGNASDVRVRSGAALRVAKGAIATSTQFEAPLALVACEIPVDLSQLFQSVSRDDESDESLACIVVVELERRMGSGDPRITKFIFNMPLRVQRGQPDWLACVDFGTSCTAIWIGRSGGDRSGMFLPLGDWLADVDPTHDESGWWDAVQRGPGNRARRAPRVLLPSQIGLSPDLNMRTDFDPLSLDDLGLALSDEDSVLTRLTRSNRIHDISVPFPSREKMAENLDAIVMEPKKRMILRENHVALGTPVFRREAGALSRTRHVDLATLVEECFDELGRYVAVNALQRTLATGAADATTARRIARDRLESGGRFAVVVTHPSGIDASRRNIYRRAGRRFLEAFVGPQAEPSHAADVKLVPEALAAARYGIQKFIDAEGIEAGGGMAQTFITLDIGAGTYDVTVIDARVNAKEVRDWKVQSHFGLAIGGNDLDRALVAVVASILGAAAATAPFQEAYELASGLPANTAETLGFGDAARAAGLRFLSEIQAAKARLSQRLLDVRGEPYIWPRRQDGGPPLQIRVGKPGGDDPWPVHFRADLVASSPTPAIELAEGAARLVCEHVRDEGPEIRLEVWREALEESASTNLADLVALMGTELPDLALLEHLRTKRAAGPVRAPIWIVTGRTALWPPLFESIAQFVDGSENGGRLLDSRPFSPDQMKQAVVDGAFDLARRPWLLIDNTPPNPLAIIEYGGLGGGRRPIAIQVIAEDGQLNTVREIETTGPFVVARIVPSIGRPEGRERRINLLSRVGILPWVELTEEIPAHESQRWFVECRRDAAGVRLTFWSQSGRGKISFGPFQEGRVYGS